MADPSSRAGTRYARPELVAWVDALQHPLDPELLRAFNASEKGLPAIQVGRAEGALLGLLLGLVGARRVVECGTLAGFSALHILRALPPDGHLWTLESEADHARVARENLRLAGMEPRVTVCEGPALETLPSLEPHGPFDAVFLDADKGNYDRYGQWAERHLRPGGLLLADNAYFFGELLGEGADAAAMRRFHQALPGAFRTVCVPTPDGLVVAVKKG
jgi:caffeoyl-CoA O-methyltransferase